MRNLYEILDKIIIDLSIYEDIPFSDTDKRRLLKITHRSICKPKSRKLILVASVVLLVFALGVGLDFSTRATANNTLIGSMMEQFFHVNQGSLSEYKTILGASVTDAEVTVTLNEVLVEDNQLFINSTFNSKSFNWDDVICPRLKVFVNGVPLAGGGQIGKKQKVGVSSMSYLSAVHAKEVPLTGNLNIKLVYYDITRKSGLSALKGIWSFQFEANGETLLTQSRIIPINKHITLNSGGETIVKELKITPVSTTLIYNTSCDDESMIHFLVTDQNGVELSRAVIPTMSEELQYRFQSLNDDVTSLIITPYIVIWDEAKIPVHKTLKKEVMEIKVN